MAVLQLENVYGLRMLDLTIGLNSSVFQCLKCPEMLSHFLERGVLIAPEERLLADLVNESADGEVTQDREGTHHD